MKTKTIVLVAALLLAKLGLAALLREERRAPRDPKKVVSVEQTWIGAEARSMNGLEPGAVLRYTLDLDTKVAVGAVESSRLAIAGKVTWTGIEPSVARVQLECDVKFELQGRALEAQPGSRLRTALERGGEVELAADGTVRAIRFDGAAGSMAERFFRHVVATTQCSVPPGKATRWTAVEESADGIFTATYEATGRSPLVIKKTRAPKKLAGPLLEGQVTGQLTVEVEALTDVVLSMAGEETLVTRQGTRTVETTTTRLRLALESRSKVAVGTVARAQAKAQRIFAPATPRTRADLDAGLVRGARLDQLLEAIAKNPGAARGGDAVERIAAFARLEPSAATRISAAILALPPGDRAEAILLVALGSAGTRASEDALLSVVAARRGDAHTLAQAIPALALLADPSPRVEALLTEIHEDATLPREVQSSALLALGTVASTLRDSAPERSVALRDEMARELAASGKPGVALLALGNAGGEEVVDLVQPFLAADRPALDRARAAHALRNVAGARAETALLGLLDDGSADVRRQSAEALAMRDLDPASATKIAAALGHETDERVRAGEIRALGAVASAPGARDAIDLVSHVDASASNRLLASEILGRTGH